MRFEELSVVAYQTAERRPVEFTPVPGVGKKMRIYRRRRRITKPKRRHDPEVPAPAAEVPPEQILLGRIACVPADRDHLRAPDAGTWTTSTACKKSIVRP